jgi:hypothetical protein
MGKVRRSGRIAREIRILLLGMDATGVVFSEETRTVTLSRHGAGIISKHKLPPDGLLIMRFLGGWTETAIRLVGQLGEDARGFVYGVAFVDEDEDFWELEFPAPPMWNVQPDGPMQCESCKRCEIVDQSEVEADVLALSESIWRYCTHCGLPTVWRRVEEVGSSSGPTIVTEVERPQSHGTIAKSPRLRLAGTDLLVTESLPEPALPPAASAVVSKTVNRRKDVRTRVTLSACIRHEESEEIVECANLSKGGFAFRSRKQYPIGGEILVAVPFYLGTPPSFVTGSVRHVTALPNQNFQYGVMYVRLSGAARVAHDGHEIEHDRNDF